MRNLILKNNKQRKVISQSNMGNLKDIKNMHNISVNNFSVRRSFSFDKDYDDEDKENLGKSFSFLVFFKFSIHFKSNG